MQGVAQSPPLLRPPAGQLSARGIVAATCCISLPRSGAETLRPQARVFTSPYTETSEAAILTSWNGQLYAVIGKQREEGWQLRLWWKPFVTLIWFGGGLIAFGGLIALVGRLWRERRWGREEAE